MQVNLIDGRSSVGNYRICFERDHGIQDKNLVMKACKLIPKLLSSPKAMPIIVLRLVLLKKTRIVCIILSSRTPCNICLDSLRNISVKSFQFFERQFLVIQQNSK